MVVLVAGFLLTPTVTNPYDWTSNMWGCMSDWMTGGTVQGVDSSWILFGVLLILSIGLIIVAVGGSVYFYLFPEISPVEVNLTKSNSQIMKPTESSFDSVLITSVIEGELIPLALTPMAQTIKSAKLITKICMVFLVSFILI